MVSALVAHFTPLRSRKVRDPWGQVWRSAESLATSVLYRDGHRFARLDHANLHATADADTRHLLGLLDQTHLRDGGTVRLLVANRLAWRPLPYANRPALPHALLYLRVAAVVLQLVQHPHMALRALNTPADDDLADDDALVVHIAVTQLRMAKSFRAASLAARRALRDLRAFYRWKRPLQHQGYYDWIESMRTQLRRQGDE